MATSSEAGWYPDPSKPRTQRYWDGEQWTDHYAPLDERRTAPEEKSDLEGTDIVGYVLAVLMPLIGFIIGCVRLNKSKHGIWIIVTSVVAFIVWLALIAGSSSGTSGGGTYSLLTLL